MPSLIQKVIRGDSVAVFHFYKEYSPGILRFITAKIPKDSDAQDLVQEIFFEAIDTIAFLKNENHARAWLYKIARNKIADFYRRRKIKQVLLSEIPFLQLVDTQVHEPEFIFEKNRIRDAIEKALSSLPQNYQIVLRLHYIEQLPIKNIATMLALSAKATESLLFRARKKFDLAYERI
ncbi:MAG: RNA polymerase sigma factor [Candidatus Levybacteria bacterium]|nr:RNA polymerase sigma factor [Candidatus Levybacteria bacterium]